MYMVCIVMHVTDSIMAKPLVLNIFDVNTTLAFALCFFAFLVLFYSAEWTVHGHPFAYPRTVS